MTQALIEPGGSGASRGSSKKNLSYKVISGIMLGMGVLVSLLIWVFLYSINMLEHNLMEKHNLAELAGITQQLQENPGHPLPQTAILKIYEARDSRLHLPIYLRQLPIGYSDELEAGDFTYFVLVSQLQDRTLFIVNDISEFEQSERRFGLIIIVSWVILLGLIFILSSLLGRFMLKPISDFADEIDNLPPEVRGHQFQGRYNGLEVEKIARAVDRYLSNLDEYVERQHSFAAMASHELRTPLTIVKTSAELISAQTEDPQIIEQCRKINRSASNMNDMILALLSITRDLSADKQEKSRVDLYEVLTDVLNQLKPQLDINNTRIENWVDKAISFECNAALLTVVINNLLTNAIRHSPGGNIRISYMAHSLVILDDGEGLGTENIDSLLKKGVGDKTRGGYGLGLYITKLICEHQNWRLELQNANPGTQARIVFL